jgi:hypothetical protein
MARRALCVGINTYGIPGQDLNGCVNDARAWQALLVDHFDFVSDEVTVLVDQEATKEAIVSGLERLITGAAAGDVLVFTNSSHGSQIPDTSGDEETYDEVLCPHDVRANVITDDELRELLTGLSDGLHMTVISDSCHSGTLTRAPFDEMLPEELRFPDQRRVRFLNPALIRGGPILADPMGAPPRQRFAFPESEMNHLLLSGCTDREYSYDAKIGGTFHGAMTYYALEAIQSANYEISYAELADHLQSKLEDAGYFQHPQLEGAEANKQCQIFS